MGIKRQCVVGLMVLALAGMVVSMAARADEVADAKPSAVTVSIETVGEMLGHKDAAVKQQAINWIREALAGRHGDAAINAIFEQGIFTHRELESNHELVLELIRAAPSHRHVVRLLPDDNRRYQMLRTSQGAMQVAALIEAGLQGDRLEEDSRTGWRRVLAESFSRAGRQDQAIEELRDLGSDLAEDQFEWRIRVARALASALQAAGQLDEAENALREAFVSISASVDSLTDVESDLLDSLIMDLADICAADEREPEAIALVLPVLESRAPLGRDFISRTRALAANPSLEQEDQERLLPVLHRSIADLSLAANDRFQYQHAVVRLLLNMDQPEQALREARVMFYTSDEKTINEAADLIVECFKRIDFNLARANAFLRFQKRGDDTGEDETGEASEVSSASDTGLVDVLRMLEPIEAADRSAIFQTALDGHDRTWDQMLSRAVLHIYLEDPPSAFSDMQRAFRMCPPDQGSLQRVVNAMTELIVRHTGDSEAAETLVRYIMYGEAGPDGKPGTADDIANPLPAILKRLAYGPAVTQRRPVQEVASRPAEPEEPELAID